MEKGEGEEGGERRELYRGRKRVRREEVIKKERRKCFCFNPIYIFHHTAAPWRRAWVPQGLFLNFLVLCAACLRPAADAGRRGTGH